MRCRRGAGTPIVLNWRFSSTSANDHRAYAKEYRLQALHVAQACFRCSIRRITMIEIFSIYSSGHVHLCLSEIAFALTLALTAVTASADEGELIEYLQEELSDIREHVEARDAAPVEGGYFKNDRSDYQSDIDAVLDKALRLVVPKTFDTWAERGGPSNSTSLQPT